MSPGMSTPTGSARPAAAWRVARAWTDAMLASGFNTKSNFNREFRRVTGRTPSDWRDAAAGEKR